MRFLQALIAAMIVVFATATVVPLHQLRRAYRRDLLRGSQVAPVYQSRWLMYVQHQWMKHTQLIRWRITNEATYMAARLLALYSLVTRQPEFEGFTLSKYRWIATINFAFHERRALRAAEAEGRNFATIGGRGLVRSRGEWKLSPAGAAKTHVGQVSPLYYKKVAGGLPVLMDMTVFPGNIFFVDSGDSDAGDSAGKGTTPDIPFSTWDYAVGNCTASQGDVVFLLPGQTDTVSAAGGLDLDVAGTTYIGVGNGTVTPTLTLDTADTADIDIGAANIRIENVLFTANFADIAAAIDVDGTDFTLYQCRFQETATDMNAKIWVQDAAAAASDRITIENCRAIGLLDAANTHFVNFAGTGTGHKVSHNFLTGDWGTMCVGGAGVITYCEITHNFIMNEASDNDSCINVAATATGVIAFNMCAGAAAQANGIASGDCTTAENYYGVHTEDLSAILDPVVT